VPDFVDRIIKENRLFGYSGAAAPAATPDQENAAEAAARAISSGEQ